VNLELLLMS